MKRNIILIGLLSVFSFAVLGVFGVQAVSVSAETAVEEIVTEESTVEEVAVEETPKEEVTTDTVAWLTDSFVMNFGASVRIGDMVTDENGNVTYENYGIRFSVTAKTTAAQTAFANLANSDAVTGVLIAPQTSLKNAMAANGISDKNAALTAKTVFEDKWYDFATAGMAWTDTTIYNLVSTITDNTLYGAIINLNTTNFLQKYTGVAYVGVPATYNEDGSVATYTYYFAKYAEGEQDAVSDVSNNTRCMYYVAQKAIENGDEEASVLRASYIDAFAAAHSSITTTQKFKYTVHHHYVTGYDSLHAPVYSIKTESRGGLLNESIVIDSNLVLSAEESASGDEETYPYNDFATAGKNKGIVYAGGMQVLHVYYGEKIADDSGSTEGGGDSTGGTEPETPRKTVSELLSASDASTKYFKGGLEYVDGKLVSTDRENAEGQPTVIFTAEFLYDLQQNGYTTITIPTLYSTTTGDASWLFPTSSVKMTGYEGADGTYSIESKKIDGVTYTYIPDSITISLNKKLEYNETDKKYYYEGTTTEVTGISIQPYSWASGIVGGALIGRDWVFEDLIFA